MFFYFYSGAFTLPTLKRTIISDIPFLLASLMSNNSSGVRGAKKYDEARGIWQARVDGGWRFYSVIPLTFYTKKRPEDPNFLSTGERNKGFFMEDKMKTPPSYTEGGTVRWHGDRHPVSNG